MIVTPAQKIRIGIFTLAGILLLFIGIFLIGNRRNMFTGTFTIYGVFKNVGGLQVGNNIRFAGITIGTVDGIQIISDTTVRVDMNLQSKVKSFLKKNATASIGSDGLMGDKLVTISGIADTSNTGLLQNGDRIEAVDPIDFGKVMDRIALVVDNAALITSDLSDITGKINSGKGSLGKLLNSDTLSSSLIGTVNSIKKSSEGFNQNMDALHHNFLLKGFFKKKDKEKQKAAEAAQKKKEQDAKDKADKKKN